MQLCTCLLLSTLIAGPRHLGPFALRVAHSWSGLRYILLTFALLFTWIERCCWCCYVIALCLRVGLLCYDVLMPILVVYGHVVREMGFTAPNIGGMEARRGVKVLVYCYVLICIG